MTNVSLAIFRLVTNFTPRMAQLRDKILLQNIALVFKELRELNGLTQEVAADESKIHIGRIESAKINITISTLSALCDYFGISLIDFFQRVEDLKEVKHIPSKK